MSSISTWKVEVQLFDHDDSTTAHAVLTTSGGKALHGHGRAQRNPADADVPEIGEEVAASRALRDVAAQLLLAASGDISQIEHQEVHLQR